MKTNAPSSTSLIWLIAALFLAAMPHFFYQPIWVSIIFVFGLVWRSSNIFFGFPLPKGNFDLMRVIQLSVGIIAIVCLFVTYGSTIGRDAGVAFLITMLGLKVTEIKNHRDYYLTTFLGYFVVITNFFFTQSMLMVMLMFVVVIVMTACLISINNPSNQLSAKKMTQLSSKMLVQAVPMMLVLFVLFPRIPGPLWGLPEDAHGTSPTGDFDRSSLLTDTAITGINNKMKLGHISRLIQSNEVAFRVQFEDEIPASEDLYWRGPVLWETDGNSWFEPDYEILEKRPKYYYSDEGYNYQVVLEPHNQHWLFALDLPSKLPDYSDAYLTNDVQLKSRTPINQRILYKVNSTTDYFLDNNVNFLLKLASNLPKGQHPKTVQLASEWRSFLPNDEDYIEHVLTYFNQQEFYYTLTPPKLSGDVIDQFLFESKRGFCEHYSASFTVLMRAAGIPTRIVAGYQGGEINPVSGDLVVRQRDAHAWTEVWLDDKGWTRVDPTAAVSARIESGMNEIMPPEMRSPALIAQNDFLRELWQNIEHNWDALDSLWDLWVLSYSSKLQLALLAKLGIDNPNWQKLAWLMGAFIFAVLIIMPLFVFSQRKPEDLLTKNYQLFCDKLKQASLLRSKHEGPLMFGERAMKTLPQHAQAIEDITTMYINLKYGKQSYPIDAFEQAVKKFKQVRF